jgi:hypothetical protein
MKKITILPFLMVCIYSLAQGKINFVFNEQVHDFGTLKEEDKKASTIFTFINLSEVPIVIQDVKSSCGCTTPNYSNQPIAPNQEGKIVVSYATTKRPGVFTKTISVKISDGQDARTEVLTVKGAVLPLITDKIEDSFTNKIGSLLFRTKKLDLGTIFKGQEKHRAIEIYNPTNNDIKLTFGSLPACLEATFADAPTIAHQKGIELFININTNKIETWGVFSDEIVIKENGKESGSIAVEANITEDFLKISNAELKSLPVAKPFTRNINLMEIKTGTSRKTTIQLQNTGKSPLLIRGVRVYDSYIKTKTSTNIVTAGKIANIEIEIDAQNLSPAAYRKQIEVATNDANNPIIVINIEWKVF